MILRVGEGHTSELDTYTATGFENYSNFWKRGLR